MQNIQLGHYACALALASLFGSCVSPRGLDEERVRYELRAVCQQAHSRSMTGGGSIILDDSTDLDGWLPLNWTHGFDWLTRGPDSVRRARSLMFSPSRVSASGRISPNVSDRLFGDIEASGTVALFSEDLESIVNCETCSSYIRMKAAYLLRKEAGVDGGG